MDNEEYTNKKIIDWDLADELANHNHNLAKEMLKMLIESLPAHQKELNDAYQSNNLEELRLVTHKLHGATCYCGTPRLKLAAKNLEHHLKQQERTQVKQLYQSLQNEIDSALKAYPSN